MTDSVVISGATTVPVADSAPAPLLAVPEFVDLAIADPGTGPELVIENRAGAPLRIAVEGVGDISIPPAGSTVVALPEAPGSEPLHLQALSVAQSRVVLVIVSVEPSGDGPVAVGQAIGARTC